jgi:hypothetical protein
VGGCVWRSINNNSSEVVRDAMKQTLGRFGKRIIIPATLHFNATYDSIRVFLMRSNENDL